MERIYTNATTKFALLMATLVIIGCSDSGNATSAKYKDTDTSSFHEDEGSSNNTNNQTSNNGITYGSYSYGGGTTVRTVSINGITYMLEGSSHCPSGWHEMTFDECTYLHENGSLLDPIVFSDSFEIAKITVSKEPYLSQTEVAHI